MERIGLIRVNHGDECWVGAEIDFISGPGDHTTNSGGMSDLAHNMVRVTVTALADRAQRLSAAAEPHIWIPVNPEAFRADGSWIEAVKVMNGGAEHYEAVRSRRVWLSSGAEVEISFAPVAWASSSTVARFRTLFFLWWT